MIKTKRNPPVIAPKIRLPALRDTIYDRYLEIFHKPEHKDLREKYEQYIAGPAREVTWNFARMYIDGLLDEEINKTETERMNVALYKRLRWWVYTQVISGMELVLVRALVEEKPVAYIGSQSKVEIERFIEINFWNIPFDNVADELGRLLILRDTDQAIEAIRNNVEGIDVISIAFLRRFRGRLSWATALGVMIGTGLAAPFLLTPKTAN